MGRQTKSTTMQVMDGLTIKPSNSSPYWQSYCYIDGKMHRRSTGCEDVEQAKLVAHEHYYNFKRNVDDGLETGKVSFQKLTDVYLSSIKHEGKFENNRDAIKRHFTPFFGEIQDITSIKAAKMLEYLHYRRTKNDEVPMPQTINRENTVLNQMFKYAVKQAWIKELPDIERQSERNQLRRRPHFTHKEYRQLYTVSRSRMARLKDIPLKTYTRWQRQLLNDVIFFLANSGMRVDEMKTVIWRNVDFTNGHVNLQHAGKVRSSRRIVMRKSATNALLRIRKRREEWLDAQEIETGIRDTEFVFALPNGTTVSNFKKGFDGLLKECGFVYNTKHDKHALTSLRHTYATFSLTRRKGKRATMRALAMQMGTSEKMIQRHYGHDEIMDYEDELRGE
jgi:integrase